MNEIDRIEKSDYVPTAKDILYCRKATKGVHEFTIRIEVRPRHLRTHATVRFDQF